MVYVCCLSYSHKWYIFYHTNMDQLDLECSFRISEVCFVVFDGFVLPVESVFTAVAVPVRPFKMFSAFNCTSDRALFTTS